MKPSRSGGIVKMYPIDEETPMSYASLLGAAGINAAAIALLAYAVYYRRHRRADLPLAFVSLNLGVFAAVALLANQTFDLALGFGLFAILSIVRLRSTTISQAEVGYYFIALVLGLVNALGYRELPMALILDALLIGVVFALDRPRLGTGVSTRRVVLEVVHEQPEALQADIERRLGPGVVGIDVIAVDYVKDMTTCDVRIRPTAAAQTPRRARVAAVQSPVRRVLSR